MKKFSTYGLLAALLIAWAGFVFLPGVVVTVPFFGTMGLVKFAFILAVFSLAAKFASYNVPYNLIFLIIVDIAIAIIWFTFKP